MCDINMQKYKPNSDVKRVVKYFYIVRSDRNFHFVLSTKQNDGINAGLLNSLVFKQC